MTMGQRIRQLREIHGMTQEYLGDCVGASKQTIYKYEQGIVTNIPLDTLYALASALRTTPGYLTGWGGPDDDGPAPAPKANTVPLVGRVAAGTSVWDGQNIEEYIPAAPRCQSDFALRFQGDSMINARIFDGDIVYIHSQRDVDNGEIAAVLIGEEIVLRKVFRTPDRLALRAENPMYSDSVFAGEEIKNVRILGKAMALSAMVPHEIDRVDGEWRRYVGQPIAARGGGVRPMNEAQAKMAWKHEQSRLKNRKPEEGEE